MISNYTTQIYLRSLILDAINNGEITSRGTALTNSNFIAENRSSDNKAGLYITEHLLPVSERQTSIVETGTGVYELVVWDDKDTGLRVREIAEQIADVYDLGNYPVYDVPSAVPSAGSAMDFVLTIQYVKVGSILSERNSGKVSIAVDIYYSKTN